MTWCFLIICFFSLSMNLTVSYKASFVKIDRVQSAFLLSGAIITFYSLLKLSKLTLKLVFVKVGFRSCIISFFKAFGKVRLTAKTYFKGYLVKSTV